MTTAGEVFLRPPAAADRDEFVNLMRASQRFHRAWASAPTDEHRFAKYLADSVRPDFEAMLVCRIQDGAIIGFFNLSQIRRGVASCACLGYAVGKSYAGQGYMREAIQLVLERAFTPLGIDRVEANIQPTNTASIALAEGAGFTREDVQHRYLKIGGWWRDHERWTLRAEDWRARGEDGR